ncbi:MAG: MipA/OmpV family protein [Alteromonadaceae bacterium]|nr:MipA/OmpV family protein [Alteromonadaceae bacterium]
MQSIRLYQLYVVATSIILLFVFSSKVWATETPASGFFIAGPALNPEYRGSEDFTIVPMIVSQYQSEFVNFEIEGLTARAELWQQSAYTIGVTAEFDFGRDSDVESELVKQLKEIDASINGGVYAAWASKDQFLDGDNLAYRIALFTDLTNTHNGLFTTLTATYTLPLAIPWRFEFELETTYASNQYMDTYFSIIPAAETAAELPAFTAGASLRDITFSTNIGFFTSEVWGAFLRLSASRLTGDAKDSPIVNDGTANQYFAGLGIIYRFGGNNE